MQPNNPHCTCTGGRNGPANRVGTIPEVCDFCDRWPDIHNPFMFGVKHPDLREFCMRVSWSGDWPSFQGYCAAFWYRSILNRRRQVAQKRAKKAKEGTNEPV